MQRPLCHHFTNFLKCVDRIAFTYGDKPVEWRRGLCVTDGFSYFNELS